MQVRATHADTLDADQHVVNTGFGRRPINQNERAGLFADDSFHGDGMDFLALPERMLIS
jgi:hypothetical protein